MIDYLNHDTKKVMRFNMHMIKSSSDFIRGRHLATRDQWNLATNTVETRRNALIREQLK
jgi:hypothetical protein